MRAILVGIAVILVLPGLLFGGILLDRFAESERADYRTEAVANAARVADALDRELGILVAAARVLTTSPALAAGDIAAFEREARAVGGVLGQEVILAQPHGMILLDTSVPLAPDLLATDLAETFRLVVSEQRPLASDLFRDGSGRPRVAVLAPVSRNGAVIFVVGLVLEPEYFSSVLRSLALPAGWIASVRDSHTRLFARNRDAERYIGAEGAPVGEPTGAGARRVWTTTALDGTRVLTATTRTKAAGWRVAIGAPLALVDAPIRISVTLLGASFLLSLLVGCVLAGLLAQAISVLLRRLAAAGRALGAGEAVLAVPSRISEIDAVSRALGRADADLRSRGAALAAERARLAAIIETVPVGLMIAEAPSGRVVAGNRELGRMLWPLLTAGDAASPFYDEEGAPVPAGTEPLLRALAGEDKPTLRCRYRRADGSLFWVNAVAAPIRSSRDEGHGGEITGAVVALLDIDEVVRAREQKARWAERLEEEVAARTDDLARANQLLRDEMSARNQAEERLRQAQKMEAVGRLTGGIAHDFNNLLTVVVGSLDLLRRRVTDLRAVQLIANAQDGASRAADLIARLLAFSRRQPLVAQAVDLNRLVSDTAHLLRRTLGETIAVETRLDPGAWLALTDANQLENALLNLAVNARDAIHEASPGGGRLVLATANATVPAGPLPRVSDARPGDYVMVSAADSGAGMTVEVLSHVFEPFFTTKPVGQGTGLGLSQVHGFVVQSGGHVEIESEPGRGTTVRLFLPRLAEGRAVKRAVEPAPAVPATAVGATILLVEDEEGVREFAAAVLVELGYEVLTAEQGQAALVLLDAHPETALVVTDLVMAGMGGRELAEHIGRHRPLLPILFTTGYDPAALGDAGDPRAVLGKPFTVAELAAKVAEALG